MTTTPAELDEALEAAQRIIDYWGPDYGNEDEVIVARFLLDRRASGTEAALREALMRAAACLDGAADVLESTDYPSAAVGVRGDAKEARAALSSPPRDGE